MDLVGLQWTDIIPYVTNEQESKNNIKKSISCYVLRIQTDLVSPISILPYLKVLNEAWNMEK